MIDRDAPIQVKEDNLIEVVDWLDGAGEIVEGGIRWRYWGAPFSTFYDTVIPVGWWFFRRSDGGAYARAGSPPEQAA